MFTVAPLLSRIGLLLALWTRLMGGALRTARAARRAPSALFQRCLARTQPALAMSSRATLAADGAASPNLDDIALVA